VAPQACGVCSTSVHVPVLTNCHPFIYHRRVLTQRVTKTSLYLQMFEESINRKSKYSMAATEEFCMRPDMFLERWVAMLLSTFVVPVCVAVLQLAWTISV
jgi:hypothetical protein